MLNLFSKQIKDRALRRDVIGLQTGIELHVLEAFAADRILRGGAFDRGYLGIWKIALAHVGWTELVEGLEIGYCVLFRADIFKGPVDDGLPWSDFPSLTAARN